mmetsp:Transcript_6737/g.16799  ORF Transcript_6737/g.16799 Transcript_6737/m.16799 type:complete len:255 (+) Transcript_6737:155-919(+)
MSRSRTALSSTSEWLVLIVYLAIALRPRLTCIGLGRRTAPCPHQSSRHDARSLRVGSAVLGSGGLDILVGLGAAELAVDGDDIARLALGAADHEERDEEEEREDEAEEGNAEDEHARLVEELDVGREDQRDGRARRRDRAADDRDADAVQRPLCLFVPVALGFVVEVGEVHRVVDGHAHDHHDEDARVEVELEAHAERGGQHPRDRGADRDHRQHGHQRIARDQHEDKVGADQRDDNVHDRRALDAAEAGHGHE